MAASPRAAQAVRLAALVAALVAAATATTLTAYPSCGRLLAFYHANAIERASEFARRPVPRGRFGAAVVPIAAPQALAAPAAPAALADSAPTAGADFSDTNVQVAGVDEPDIVKTDGTRVFTVRGSTLTLVRADATRARGRVVAKLELPTSVREMLIERDTLLLIGTYYGDIEPGRRPPPPPPTPFFPGPVSRQGLNVTMRSSPPIFFGESVTAVYRVSAAGGRLRLLESLRLQGNYVSAREVRGVVRLVTTFRPSYSFTYNGPIARGAPAPAAAARTIRRTRLATWLPRFRFASGCYVSRQGTQCRRVSRGLLVSCNRVYRPSNAFSGFGLLSVTTLRMGGVLNPRGSTGVVSNGQDVYATASALYVATTGYQNDFQFGLQLGAAFRTSFHKFWLRPFATVYAGSGSVAGSVLNQFAMHEYRGVFFVATTVGAPWWGSRDQSKSRVTAFRQAGRSLRLVGSVGNLGVGERIYAVRYVRDLAYVVTFREVDPLYIIDIRNPARMRVTGELKIPGFSSYLHPIGNGRLLGVGRDATPDGRTTGAKVSLFDVSDVTNPREVTAWTLKGSYSSAGWDHRAFLYWAPRNVAVLPVNLYSSRRDENFSGSIVLEIGAAQITEKGRIAHPKCCGEFAFQPSIERNFVLGRTNLWSLSSKWLQVNDITNLMFKSRVQLSDS